MQEQPRENFASGLWFVLIATLGWSLSGIFVRMMPELSGWQINCWRGYWLGVALACYLVVAYGKRLPDQIRAIPISAFITSSLCFAIGTTAYISALTFTTTATVSVIGATSPLVTGALSPWMTNERPSRIIWFAVVIAVLGAGVIGYNAAGEEDTGTYNHAYGVAISLLVPLTFAFQTLLLRRHKSIDLMPAICLGGFVAFVGCGIMGWLFTDTPGFAVDLQSLGLLMLMGPAQLALPLIFYGMGAKHVSAAALSVLSMLDAVLNPLWPWLILDETPSRYTVIGGAIILGAVMLSIFGAHYYDNARRLSTR
jgi:drug/metabolite transporter, DME family